MTIMGGDIPPFRKVFISLNTEALLGQDLRRTHVIGRRFNLKRVLQYAVFSVADMICMSATLRLILPNAWGD